MDQDKIRQFREEQSVQKKEADDKQLQVTSNLAVINTINKATKALIKFQRQHEPNVSVKNYSKSPDIVEVVKALRKLEKALISSRPDNSDLIKALSGLSKNLAQIPTEIKLPEIPKPPDTITVKNQPDYKKEFAALNKTLKSIDVKPQVNVQQNDVDISLITESLKQVGESIAGIKLPNIPDTDLTPLVKATAAVKKSIEALRFPVSNYVLPFRNEAGKADQLQLTSDGKVPVSGTVTATPTGTQNVDVTANSIGLATSAKQDTLLTELQLKADLTETQPVSLASVPSHAVTNAGTFATQATLQTGTNAVGYVGTSPNAINVGQRTVSTTAVQVSASATVPTNGILVQALAGNAAAIYVGGSGVTTSTGWELSPGQAIAFTCTLNTIYIISVASTTDKICYQVV